MLLELVIKVTSARNWFYRALESGDASAREAGESYLALLDEYLADMATGLEEYVASRRESPRHPAADLGPSVTGIYIEEGLRWARAEREKVQETLRSLAGE